MSISCLHMTSFSSSLARIHHTWVEKLPSDLYIPPEAFAILLDHFEGPLDFLLYLVKKNGVDLCQIDIAPIASQYLAYINLMQQVDVELAADYLVMAALLADIKSRLLLPKPSKLESEEDPRINLLERLARYAKIKAVAQQLQHAEILGRDRYLTAVARPAEQTLDALGGFSAQLLHYTMQALLSRPTPDVHEISAESVDLAERIDAVQRAVQSGQPVRFTALLLPQQGRMGVVVTLLAILELLRQRGIEILDDGLDRLQPLRVIRCAG